MFHSRKLNHQINRMHDKCLPVVYNGNTSSYEKFLEIDTYVSDDHRNNQIYTTTLFYATELYKTIVNGLLPDITKHFRAYSDLYKNSAICCFIKSDVWLSGWLGVVNM